MGAKIGYLRPHSGLEDFGRRKDLAHRKERHENCDCGQYYMQLQKGWGTEYKFPTPGF